MKIHYFLQNFSRHDIGKFEQKNKKKIIHAKVSFEIEKHLPLIVPSILKAFRSCNAHVHKSHVVMPSGLTVSSQKGGRGGGGTNRPFHKPLSLASNGNDE